MKMIFGYKEKPKEFLTEAIEILQNVYGGGIIRFNKNDTTLERGEGLNIIVSEDHQNRIINYFESFAIQMIVIDAEKFGFEIDFLHKDPITSNMVFVTDVDVDTVNRFFKKHQEIVKVYNNDKTYFIVDVSGIIPPYEIVRDMRTLDDNFRPETKINLTHTNPYKEPTFKCPDCGIPLFTEWVDNGFGPYSVQASPYVCKCGWSEIGCTECIKERCLSWSKCKGSAIVK